MTIGQLYQEAVDAGEKSLLLLLEFLLFEKKTIKPNDPISVLEIYLLDKHKNKMNQLLKEYLNKRTKEETF